MKNRVCSYAFVEFEDDRDAREAYREMRDVRFEGYRLDVQVRKKRAVKSFQLSMADLQQPYLILFCLPPLHSLPKTLQAHPGDTSEAVVEDVPDHPVALLVVVHPVVHQAHLAVAQRAPMVVALALVVAVLVRQALELPVAAHPLLVPLFVMKGLQKRKVMMTRQDHLDALVLQGVMCRMLMVTSVLRVITRGRLLVVVHSLPEPAL